MRIKVKAGQIYRDKYGNVFVVLDEEGDDLDYVDDSYTLLSETLCEI